MQVIARVFILAIVSVSVLVACSSTGVKESGAGKNSPAPAATRDDHIDGFFVAPELDLSRYNKLIVRDLQLDNIQVVQPASRSEKNAWVLSDRHKRIFRESYISAVVGHMIADGVYTTALDNGENVLLLQAAIVQIAPFSSTENSSNNTTEKTMSMQREQEGMATIAIEIYDSQTGDLLATLTDSYNFGRVWQEGNLPISAAPIHNAFDFWLDYLRQELDTLSAR